MIWFLPIGTDQPWKKFPKVTAGIVVLCVVVHIIKINLDGDSLSVFWKTFAWLPGYCWYNPISPLTSNFIHANFRHLFFNMIFLIAFGPTLESKLGSKNYLILFCLGGIGGSYFDSIVLHGVRGLKLGGIGASGAISAVMGAFLIRCYYARVRIIPRISGFYVPKTFLISGWIIIGAYFLIDLIWGFFSLKFGFYCIGYLAHIGGFLSGAVLCLLIDGRRQARSDVLWGRMWHWREKLEGKAQAAFELKDIVKLCPSDAGAWLELARLELRLGRKDKSMEYYERAVRLFFQQKNPEQTIIALKEYFRRFKRPFPPRFQFKLNRLLELSGEAQILHDMLQSSLLNWDELPGTEGAEFLRLKFRQDMERLEVAIQCGKALRPLPRHLSSKRIQAMLFTDGHPRKEFQETFSMPSLWRLFKGVWIALSSLVFLFILFLIVISCFI